jgi:glycosyltransferase involved in cell wall biosynthesis
VSSTSEVDFVHIGTFSGSAPSLRDAMERSLSVRSVDLLPLAREPRLLGARAWATAEAVAAGHLDIWKTGTWSAALQRCLAAQGVLDTARPKLIVQTVPALVLDASVRYAVYTDRVGLEGAADGSQHRSRTTPGWTRREAALLRGAEAVFVMGPSTKRVLIERYGLPENRVEVVGAGPNLELSSASQKRDGKRLLFVGLDWERKGGPVLLEAFERIRAADSEVVLTVAGGGPSESLPPGVRHVGKVRPAELERLYDTSDVFVLPTRMEAFGIVLVEALIKGLPCVHSTVGNQRWIVEDAGISVPPDDPLALADALLDVIGNYSDFHARALARGGTLRQTMSWQTVADRIAERLVG